MEGVDDFQGLIDLCICDQAISSCPIEMRNWIKEKSPNSLNQLNELGDQYVALYGHRMKQGKISGGTPSKPSSEKTAHNKWPEDFFILYQW